MTDSSHGALVVVRGAGEMGSGVIHRLATKGHPVIALEKSAPDFVRRPICFAEAVYEGRQTVEGITARLGSSLAAVEAILAEGDVPVAIDPDGELIPHFAPAVLVDARMEKKPVDCSKDLAPLVIGIGPGFAAGENCHRVIESHRGPNLGEVITEGTTQPYTGTPAPVAGETRSRVLRSPTAGTLTVRFRIGELIEAGDTVCMVDDVTIHAELSGVLRGLIRDGSRVVTGQKIGDIDPRGDPSRCFRISTKARAIGAGVLRAIETARFRRAPP